MSASSSISILQHDGVITDVDDIDFCTIQWSGTIKKSGTNGNNSKKQTECIHMEYKKCDNCDSDPQTVFHYAHDLSMCRNCMMKLFTGSVFTIEMIKRFYERKVIHLKMETNRKRIQELKEKMRHDLKEKESRKRVRTETKKELEECKKKQKKARIEESDSESESDSDMDCESDNEW